VRVDGSAFGKKGNAMAKVTLDGKEYDTEEMTEEARNLIASVQFIEQQLQKKRNEVSIAKTARGAYARALKKELGSQDS